MTDSNDTSSGSVPSRRRSSFAGQALDFFGSGRQRPSVNQDNTNPTATFPRAMTAAAAEAQRRRMSLTTLGISGSPNQTSPFSVGVFRRDSIASANSNSIDESAVEDDVGPSACQPTTPFGRRVSFGAKAFRDVKASNNGQSPGNGGDGGGGADRPNGRSSIAQTGVSSPSAPPLQGSDGGKKTTPPSAKGRGDGYNWADSFRNRASRSASIVSTGGSPNPNHTRAKSIATMQPPPAAELPKSNVPDHFQERILKGDFYMD